MESLSGKTKLMISIGVLIILAVAIFYFVFLRPISEDYESPATRAMTNEELKNKFGFQIFEQENFKSLMPSQKVDIKRLKVGRENPFVKLAE